ncbi:DUF2064 domain-containing protein [Halovenus rubra]|uniref:DUF2064 domain-containing protein n=2 Tax=Halovenus rubra TaxID=869890 RepID=A0ABD5X835_9EURY|nr:DUF2064 domain-containing protein [Halovenus rubra]
MTTVVVPAELADEEPLPALQPEPLSREEASVLYRASLLDVCTTVQHGEADLLVNYPDAERVASDAPETELRDLLADELANPDAARYEVQVGETDDSRVGNALTYLLETESEPTAGVLDPTVPLLRRDHIGAMAMKLRASDVVLGPTTDGGLYFAGFSEPVDFTDSYDSPAVETMTQRAREAGLSVEYLPVLPRIDTQSGLATTAALIRARDAAERIVPSRTTACLEELALQIDDGTVAPSSDRS